MTLLIVGAIAMALGAIVGILRHGIDVLGTIDPALDAEHTYAMGHIDHVDELDLGIGKPLIAIDFQFVSPTGATITGRSFAKQQRAHRRGDTVTIEFASADPSVARMQGTLCNPFQPTWSRWSGIVFWPLVLLSILWLRDHSQRKALLVLGRETEIEILDRTPRGRRVAVRYRYRDAKGAAYFGTTTVAATHVMATSVTPNPGTIAVVHDERDASRHRLVTGDDFKP